MKIKQKLMILMCISALFLSACSSGGSKTVSDDNDVVQTESVTAMQETDLTKFTNDPFEQPDLYSEWSKSRTTIITMNEEGIQQDGNADSGVTIDGNHITISKSGDFSISGVCDDGSVTVDCEESGNVRIILDNCSMTNQSGSVFNIKKADKVIVTSSFGTSNLLADGSSYADSEATGAAIASSENMTFNGEGELTINGNYQSAVSCDKDLKFASGTYNINGKDNGVIANQGISLKNGSYSVQTSGAGFKTTSTKDGEGFVGIETGNYVITSGSNAIDAAGDMYYLNGSLTIMSGNGSSVADGISAKGIVSGRNFEMYGGSAQLQTADDAVYAGENVEVVTGCLNVTSEDDGIVAGEVIEIAGGSVVLSKCVEGFESNGVNLTGGFIDINATNDGINVCGGNDSSVAEERAGKNAIERSGEGDVTIDQTCINIKSDMDAIDVVGNLNVLSGALNVRGGASEGCNAIDCSKEYLIKNGNINAAGVDAEAVKPADASEQNTVILEYADVQAANTVICVKNDKDEMISCFAPAGEYSKALISKADFTEGKKYTWYAATIKEEAQTKYGEVVSDDVELGDKIAEFKVEKGVTIVK